MRILSRLALLVLSLAVLTAPMSARAADTDVYFGYSRLGSNAFNGATPGLNGWEAEGAFSFIPLLGVDIDVAHYGLGAAADIPHTTTALIGPRLTLGYGGVHVYGHALMGGEHSTDSGNLFSSTGFTVAAGAGVDMRVFHSFSWRINADYIDAPGASPSGGDHYRFGTGLVFRF